MRRAAAVLLASALAVAAAGCSGDDQPESSPTSPAPATTSAPAPPRATPAPAPPRHGCYRLTYDQAVAPTASAPPTSCAKGHTAATYAVGRLDTVAAGHLLAVDSDRVRAQVADACPAQFPSFVGGSLADRRLSMLRPVWFTPTVAQSDAGASWYRCDVVALAADGELAPLSGKVAGVLDTPEGRDRYGMCATAQPGAQDFQRVICSRDHSWRAIAVVPFRDGPYPGAKAARAAGQGPCRDAGASVAADSLNYQWGYEWPTAEQWKDGQRFGRCWAPD